jgi:preprotein translocase subunit SecG
MRLTKGRWSISGHNATVALVVVMALVVGAIVAMEPVAAAEGGGGGGGGGGSGDVSSSLGEALCNAGAGILLTAVFYIASIALIYLGVIDGIKAFVEGGDDDPRRRAGTGSTWQSAVKKFLGGVLVASAPTILSAIGFSLLSCVSAIDIIS